MSCKPLTEMLRSKIGLLERELRQLGHVLDRRSDFFGALDQSALSLDQHEMIDGGGVEIAFECRHLEQAIDEACRELWSHAPMFAKRPLLQADRPRPI